LSNATLCFKDAKYRRHTLAAQSPAFGGWPGAKTRPNGSVAKGKAVILITGGAGYIGSHMGVALAQAGERYLVLDNQQQLTLGAGAHGAHHWHAPECVTGDVRDAALLKALFAQHRISAVIHLLRSGRWASRCASRWPITTTTSRHWSRYCRPCRPPMCARWWLSTVYGEPAALPIREDFDG
jgi:UDP-glucose 4-epimerase